MPLTPDQLDNWFTYHEPTLDTAPKYTAIRKAEELVASCGSALLNGGGAAKHDIVNDRCRAFTEVIDANAPDSADKSAAIRCVRLARNALNEALVVASKFGPEDNLVVTLVREAGLELRRARWQANSAIACGGR